MTPSKHPGATHFRLPRWLLIVWMGLVLMSGASEAAETPSMPPFTETERVLLIDPAEPAELSFYRHPKSRLPQAFSAWFYWERLDQAGVEGEPVLWQLEWYEQKGTPIQRTHRLTVSVKPVHYNNLVLTYTHRLQKNRYYDYQATLPLAIKPDSWVHLTVLFENKHIYALVDGQRARDRIQLPDIGVPKRFGTLMLAPPSPRTSALGDIAKGTNRLWLRRLTWWERTTPERFAAQLATRYVDAIDPGIRGAVWFESDRIRYTLERWRTISKPAASHLQVPGPLGFTTQQP